jgi:hypothetical protein
MLWRVHAATIRRMIVFGVCALGVGSLYLVPSLARSPEQVGLPRANDEPTSQPLGTQSNTSTQSAAPSGDRDALVGSGRAGSAATNGQTSAARSDGPDAEGSHSSRKGGTREPKAGKDSEPPAPVAEIEPATVTKDRLTIKWSAATDNVGVIGYRIWLNGFEVATTAETHAKLRWFNDDGGEHVVQIRAVDAAGNQSGSSPPLVITRPSPDATPTPTPDPSGSPTPTGDASVPSRPGAQSAGTQNETAAEHTSDQAPHGDP